MLTELEKLIAYCDDVHELPENKVVEIVQYSLANGWKIDKYNQLVVADREDPSWGWCAEWKVYYCPFRIKIPHWLARRIKERGFPRHVYHNNCNQILEGSLEAI